MNETPTAEIVLVGDEPEERQIAPAATPTPPQLLAMAVQQGADIDKLEKLMGLEERWRAAEARRAFDRAFAAFKAEAVKVVKKTVVTDGPLKGKSYAKLPDVVDSLTPALSAHGLTAKWKTTKDDKDWIELSCILRHVDGHEETTTMGGPPDAGPGRNALQARASTKSYLERYTLLAITGMAASDSDDDGNGAGAALVDVWSGMVAAADTREKLDKIRKDGTAAFNKARDVEGFSAFMRSVNDRAKALKGTT